MRALAAVGVVLVALVAGASGAGGASSALPGHAIVVNGIGTVSTVPDKAQLSLGVSSDAKTASAAHRPADRGRHAARRGDADRHILRRLKQPLGRQSGRVHRCGSPGLEREDLILVLEREADVVEPVQQAVAAEWVELERDRLPG